MSEFISDVNLINQLGSQLEQMGELEDKEITTLAPGSNEVFLPGGFIGKDGILVKYAEIRELNGADEEAIAKAKSLGGSLSTALARGLVSLGGEKVSSSDLDQLLSGDRDAILLGIRIATFGKDADMKVICQSCGKDQVLKIDLEADIESVELENPIESRTFSMETKSGEVVLCLPNGITQKRLMEATSASTAELVTLILSGCIVSVNGSPSMGKATALALGIADREALVAAIYERNPGPRLGEVSKACEACGNNIMISLGLADLFRL